MRSYLKLGFIFFIFTILGFPLFSSCQRIQVLEAKVSELKTRLEIQEVLLQTLMSDNLSVISFSEKDGFYLFSFSNGLSISLNKGLLPIVSIGRDGSWLINGIDTDINAYDALPTSDIRIVDGFWYINGENTGIKAIGVDGIDGQNGKDGIDGRDAAQLIRIIEFEEFWRFEFSDGSKIDVNKEPVKYLIENEIVNDYLNKVEYDCSDYSYSMVSDYINIETSYRKDWPAPITVKWSNDIIPQNKELVERSIVVTDNLNFHFQRTLSLDDDSYILYNLAPNTPYCLKITDFFSDGSQKVIKSERIVPQGRLRMLRIDGDKVSNFRDLGGWRTCDGGTIKYGKLIRGAEVFRDSKYIINISKEGIHQLLDLGVSVELDFGDQWTFSPLSEYGIEFVSLLNCCISAYDNGLIEERFRVRYTNCIRLLIDRLKQGKSIYFHCSAGADRTGTLAFIIEGLLGVSESDMSKDYELTSLSLFGSKRRDNLEYVPFINYLKQSFDGITINHKIYNMAITPLSEGGLGLSPDEIYMLRYLMVSTAD